MDKTSTHKITIESSSTENGQLSSNEVTIVRSAGYNRGSKPYAAVVSVTVTPKYGGFETAEEADAHIVSALRKLAEWIESGRLTW